MATTKEQPAATPRQVSLVTDQDGRGTYQVHPKWNGRAWEGSIGFVGCGNFPPAEATKAVLAAAVKHVKDVLATSDMLRRLRERDTLAKTQQGNIVEAERELADLANQRREALKKDKAVSIVVAIDAKVTSIQSALTEFQSSLAQSQSNLDAMREGLKQEVLLALRTWLETEKVAAAKVKNDFLGKLQGLIQDALAGVITRASYAVALQDEDNVLRTGADAAMTELLAAEQAPTASAKKAG